MTEGEPSGEANQNCPNCLKGGGQSRFQPNGQRQLFCNTVGEEQLRVDDPCHLCYAGSVSLLGPLCPSDQGLQP